MDEDHSLGVITKSYLEEAIMFKDEPWEFLTIFGEMVMSRETWDPTHQRIIGAKTFSLFIILTNVTNDYLLSRCLKDSSKVIMN